LADVDGLRGHVRFVGDQRANVSRFYRDARFAVLPGLGGLAINQAMCHQVPVICGPADGTELDLVENDVTGIRLSEATPETLAAAMERLARDPELANAMGRNARDLVRQRFTIDHCAGAIESALVRMFDRESART